MFVIFRNEVVKYSVDFRCLPDDAEFRGGLLRKERCWDK